MSWVDWLLAFVVFCVFGAIAWDMLMIVISERGLSEGGSGRKLRHDRPTKVGSPHS